MANPNSAAAAAPTIHQVTLDYVAQGPAAQPEEAGAVRVVPETVRVRKGDTLRFIKGQGPNGATVRITFGDPGPFSAPKVEGSDQIFSVTSALKGRIGYRCELVKDGRVIAASDPASPANSLPGGNVEPASGDRGL